MKSPLPEVCAWPLPVSRGAPPRALDARWRSSNQQESRNDKFLSEWQLSWEMPTAIADDILKMSAVSQAAEACLHGISSSPASASDELALFSKQLLNHAWASKLHFCESSKWANAVEVFPRPNALQLTVHENHVETERKLKAELESLSKEVVSLKRKLEKSRTERNAYLSKVHSLERDNANFCLAAESGRTENTQLREALETAEWMIQAAPKRCKDASTMTHPAAGQKAQTLSVFASSLRPVGEASATRPPFRKGQAALSSAKPQCSSSSSSRRRSTTVGPVLLPASMAMHVLPPKSATLDEGLAVGQAWSAEGRPVSKTLSAQ